MRSNPDSMLSSATNTDLLSQFAFKTFYLPHLTVHKRESVDLNLFIVPSLNSMYLFHLRKSGFLQLRKGLTRISLHVASFSCAPASPSRIWLDAARPSRSLQNTGFSRLVHAVLCPAFWAISSALSSIPRSPHLLIWYASSRFLEPVCSFSLCPFLHQAPLACSAWNHFHTLTAQSLASCPGALRILLVTTADSPSSSSTVSPSSRGLCVVRWPHVPRAGGVSPLSTAPRALMGGIPPTVCFLATFPTWGDMWITYSKWLMSLKPHLLCLSLSVRQKCNIPANPYYKNCVKKLQNMKHGNARCEGSLLPHAGGQHPDLGLGLQQTPLTLCPDQAPLLKLCFTNVRRYADMVCSKWMLLLSRYHYIIIISIHYKVLIWFAQALNDWS